MADAQCQCGQLRLTVEGAAGSVVACHCLACQRRSGSPFGVVAYYPAEAVRIEGEGTAYERETAEGNRFSNIFCPHCGSTLFVRAGKHPHLIGVPVGAFADPGFRPPSRSVWEVSRHGWVALPDGIDHFPRGRG